MSIHKEISFEDEICAHLGANGRLYRPGDAALYDPPRALFPPALGRLLGLSRGAAVTERWWG